MLNGVQPVGTIEQKTPDERKALDIAWRPGVGHHDQWNSFSGLILTPKVLATLIMSRMAIKECPPRSKKFDVGRFPELEGHPARSPSSLFRLRSALKSEARLAAGATRRSRRNRRWI